MYFRRNPDNSLTPISDGEVQVLIQEGMLDQSDIVFQDGSLESYAEDDYPDA